MRLIEDLGAGPIPLDPAPFIALIKEHPQHLPIVPRQASGGPTANEYTIHTTYAWRSAMPSVKEIVEQAETLPDRHAVAHAVKTPESLHLATALLTKCPVFLTTDRELPAIPGIRIFTVQAYLSAA